MNWHAHLALNAQSKSRRVGDEAPRNRLSTQIPKTSFNAYKAPFPDKQNQRRQWTKKNCQQGQRPEPPARSVSFGPILSEGLGGSASWIFSAWGVLESTVQGSVSLELWSSGSEPKPQGLGGNDFWVHLGVSENRGSFSSTLNSRILITRTPN